MLNTLNSFDTRLQGGARFVLEFLYFGVKNARACLCVVFIWLAENISTFWGVWRYPNQLGAWSAVHVSKWSSWSLLAVKTFTIIAHLKHIKASIHVPEA